MREKTVRERAEGMKPLEAVDYLLCVLESVAASMVSHAPHETDYLGLKGAKRRLLIALWDADGEILTHEACIRAMCVTESVDDMPMTHNLVAVQISHLRRLLPPEIKIKTVWGVGYRMERT